MTNKKITSLLRYPGGKTRAIKYLKPYLPQNIQTLVSPFFGGGSFEFSCISDGIQVKGADIYKPLVSFWCQAISNPKALANLCNDWFPLTKEQFKHLQQIHDKETNQQLQATYFYVLNRASFSGTTASGGMSTNHPRWTKSSIDRLTNWSCNNLSIECESFETFIIKNKKHFMYLDPPYDLKNSSLYGNRGSTHRGFNHLLLREVLNEVDSWILSYNDNEEIRKLYADFTIHPLEWKYGMGNNKNTTKKSSEVIILK